MANILFALYYLTKFSLHLSCTFHYFYTKINHVCFIHGNDFDQTIPNLKKLQLESGVCYFLKHDFNSPYNLLVINSK